MNEEKYQKLNYYLNGVFKELEKNDAFLLILKGIINPFIDSLPFEELKSDILEKITNLIEK